MKEKVKKQQRKKTYKNLEMKKKFLWMKMKKTHTLYIYIKK